MPWDPLIEYEDKELIHINRSAFNEILCLRLCVGVGVGMVNSYQMMARNTSCFMSLWHSLKPVICKIHGYAIAGGPLLFFL